MRHLDRKYADVAHIGGILNLLLPVQGDKQDRYYESKVRCGTSMLDPVRRLKSNIAPPQRRYYPVYGI